MQMTDKCSLAEDCSGRSGATSKNSKEYGKFAWFQKRAPNSDSLMVESWPFDASFFVPAYKNSGWDRLSYCPIFIIVGTNVVACRLLLNIVVTAVSLIRSLRTAVATSHFRSVMYELTQGILKIEDSYLQLSLVIVCQYLLQRCVPTKPCLGSGLLITPASDVVCCDHYFMKIWESSH